MLNLHPEGKEDRLPAWVWAVAVVTAAFGIILGTIAGAFLVP